MENKKFNKIQEDDEKTILSQNASKEGSKIPLFKLNDQNIISRINSNFNLKNKVLKIQGSKESRNEGEESDSIGNRLKFFQEDEIKNSFIRKYDNSRKLDKTEKIVIHLFNIV